MKYKNYIKLAALLPLLALLGCEADETPGTESQETVPVTIRLGLEKDGLSTRADDDVHHKSTLENENEIHSLDIYILHDGTLQQTLTWEDYANSSDQVRTVELPVGDNHVYAIANLPEDAEELALEDMQKNTSIDIIKTDHSHVPMSADTIWNVSSSQSTYKVKLIRMVAKMDVQIIDERKPNTKTRAEGDKHKFTIKNFLPHETNLFRKARGAIELPEDVEFAEWEWKEIEYNTDNKAEHDAFYLHESTPQGNGFELELYDGTKTRTGSFDVNLYRNHYFPLIIHLTDYALSIDASYEYAPIGVYPIEGKVEGYSAYELEIPEGSSNIKIEITLKVNGQEETTGVTWSEVSIPYFTQENKSGKLKLTCDAFPALPSGPYTITATYKGKDIPFQLTFRKLTDEDTKSSQAPQPIIIEL